MTAEPSIQSNPDSHGTIPPTSRLLPWSAIAALLLHVLFTKLLAHFLPRADFGAVVASQMFLFAAAFPAFALQAASAAFAFAQRGVGKPISPVASFDRIATRVAIIAFVLAIVAYFAPLPKYFQLPSSSFGAAAPLLGATALLEAIATGTLLGARCERSFAAAIVASPLLRLALTGVFVALGFGSFAAIFAILAASTIVAIAARARLTRSIAAQEPDPESARRGRLRSPFAVFRGAATIGTLFGFGIFVHLDSMIVRTRLSVEDAGAYAALAVVGRVGLLMTLPLSLYLVLRVRRALIEKRNTLWLLIRALLITGLVHGAIVLLATFAPSVSTTLFLDPSLYADIEIFLPRYTTAMLVYALAQVLIFYGLAIDRAPLYLLPIGCVPLAIKLFVTKGTTLGTSVLVAEAQSLVFTSILASALALLAIIIPWATKKVMNSVNARMPAKLRKHMDDSRRGDGPERKP